MALTASELGGRWRVLLVMAALFFYGTAAHAADPHTSQVEPFAIEAPAQAATSHANPDFSWLESEFTLSAGFRSDSLDWSIAGFLSGGSPDILSELSWSDVDSCQLSVTNRSHIKKHIYFRGTGNYARIQDGTLRDSDYGEDSRAGEWSRSVSNSNDDELWDLSLGGGYSFFLMQNRLSISPLVGYSYHRQNFRITNGRQVISQDNPFSGRLGDNPPALGPLSSQLNSTYRARWKGPWIGCDLRYRIKDRSPEFPPIQLGLTVEVHWADYYGRGNWNLRGDLAHPKSFEHDAQGNGLKFSAECLIELAAHWDLSLNLNVQEWSTSRGTDRKFLQSGGSVKTRLNKVSWEATSFMIGAVYRF